MITKLRKAQDSWVAKIIFGLTALSFMSLFGISGWLNSTAGNPTVIKVNELKLTQQEFNFQLEQEIAMAKRLFGDEMPISEELRNAMVAGLVKKNLTNMVIDETAKEYKIYVSDDLIRSIIFSQIQFIGEDGKFDHQRLKAFLSASNWTEQKYINTIRSDLKKQYLVSNPVKNFNTPAVLKDYIIKSESQNKIFKYIELANQDAEINREISNEEIEQFFQDFAGDFTNPETRDASFLVVSFTDLARNADVSDAEVAEYYQANLDVFVTPESRNLLQMIFDNTDDANKAKAELEQGKDFYDVANQMAKQTKEETELGYVSQNMLIGDLGQEAFAAKKGELVGPLSSEIGSHIIQVLDIKEGSKMDDDLAKRQIVDAVKKEKSYEYAYETISSIEDKIGAGATLADIAKEFDVKAYKATGINDNGTATSFPQQLTDTLQNADFIDAVYSYNKGEISQAVETNDGFIFVKIDDVKDAHLQDRADAMPKIKKLWENSEKAAITQEIINDITSDLENGDKIEDVASRYNLKIKTSAPISRSGSFAGLSQAQIIELFNEEINAPKIFDQDEKHIVALSIAETAGKKLTDEEMAVVERRINIDTSQQAAEKLIDAYAKDFDVRVKERLLGLSE